MTESNHEWGFATRAIHAGQAPDPSTGAVVAPIYLSSTYAQDEPGTYKKMPGTGVGYEYSRAGNPTRDGLEACLASLEGGRFGLCYGSGLAATTNVMYLFSPGDHIICGQDVYGGTYRLFHRILERFGYEFTFLDTSNLAAVMAAFRPDETKLVWAETPTNPMLQITDLPALAKLTHHGGALLAVDNTFASPYGQRPLELGADLVVHSTTKYLGGHSDVVGGAVIVKDEALHETLRFHQNAVGAVPGPMDCFLIQRGVKTLPVRMERHAQNALAVARFLEEQPSVERVLYPGLESHSQHELAKRQMSCFGGMIAVDMKDGAAAASRLASRTKVFTLAESLGGVESLIEVPAVMTHASLGGAAHTVSPGLVRISVGLEDAADLVGDLAQALAG